MRFQTALPVMLVLLAAGCGGPSHYWFRQGGTLTQARTDYCDCQREAREEASAAVADKYLDRIHSPLRWPAGYNSPRDDPALAEDPLGPWPTWGKTYEQNVFAGCMKRKGYERLDAHRLPPGLHTRRLSLGAIAGR